MRVFSLVAVCVGFACCVAAVPREDPTYSLIWKPTEGQSIDYGFSAAVAGGDSNVEFLTDIHLRVTKVEADGGYTLETKRDHVRVVTDGQEHEVPDEDGNKAEVEKFNAKGDKISGGDDDDEDPDAMTALLKSTTDFESPEKPAKKGDKWTKEIKADEKKMIKAATVNYEVLGTAKEGTRDVVNVSIKYRQTSGDRPASFEGSWSFDVKDMSPVNMDINVKDAPLDESTFGSVHVRLTRK